MMISSEDRVCTMKQRSSGLTTAFFLLTAGSRFEPTYLYYFYIQCFTGSIPLLSENA